MLDSPSSRTSDVDARTLQAACNTLHAVLFPSPPPRARDGSATRDTPYSIRREVARACGCELRTFRQAPTRFQGDRKGRNKNLDMTSDAALCEMRKTLRRNHLVDIRYSVAIQQMGRKPLDCPPGLLCG